MRRTLLLALFGLALTAHAQKKNEFAGYLFAYFEGRGDAQENLRFAVSEDAQNWYALNDNRPVISSDSISESGGIRDPHILRGEHGEYLMVATDMHTLDPKQGWGSNPGIVMLRSDDLVNWTHAKVNLSKAFPEHFGDAYWVWAPQTIYDPQAKKYMVYFTLQRNDRKSLVTYYAYANSDFTAFENEPKVLFSAKYGSIDNDIIKAPDGTYHLFYKGNTKDADGKEVKNGILQATSKKLTGPWREDFKYLDVYAGTPTSVEGSGVFRLNDTGEYVLMYDLYKEGRYEFQRTKDLKRFSTTSESLRKNFFPRHGTVMSVTAEELEHLQQKWGYVLRHEFESTGNPIIRHIYTADPAAMVEGDTLWLFTGHDGNTAGPGYKMHDWQLFSTTDLKHWTQYPTPIDINTFEWAKERGKAYAAHPVKWHGKYYFFVSTDGPGIGVAVSDKITGPYHDAIGRPLLTRKDCFDSRHSWCCIDPAIFIDDDGTPYIVWGNRECYMARLKDNMVEIDGDIRRIDLPYIEKEDDRLPFTEAPWLHKYNGKYYLTYASEWPEKIAYAISDNIWGPYQPQAIISEIAGNSDTTHPAIVEFKGQWLFFSHNGGLDGGNGAHRSVIVEPMHYNADGTIQKIHPSSEGVSLDNLKDSTPIPVSRSMVQ